MRTRGLVLVVVLVGALTVALTTWLQRDPTVSVRDGRQAEASSAPALGGVVGERLGEVFDEAGAPVAGAQVAFLPPPDMEARDAFRALTSMAARQAFVEAQVEASSSTTQTNASGHFVITRSAGRVRAWSGDAWGEALLEPGPVRVTLSRSARVDVTVKGPEDEPVAGARVLVFVAGEGPPATATTSAEGTATVDFRGDEVSVLALPPSTQPDWHAALAVVKAGRATLRLGLRRKLVVTTTSDGKRVDAKVVANSSKWRQAQVASNGVSEFDVEAAHVWLEATFEGRIASRWLALPRAKNEVALELGDPATLAVTLAAPAASSPVGDVAVTLGGMAATSTQRGPFGQRFVFGPLQPMLVAVKAELPCGVTAMKDVALHVGLNEVTIQVEPRRQLEGLVVDAFNRPVAQADLGFDAKAGVSGARFSSDAGTYSLCATAPTIELIGLKVGVGRGDAVVSEQNRVLKLTSRGDVVVKVTNDDGPLAGAQVKVGIGLEVQTDARGEARLSGALGATFELRASAPHHLPEVVLVAEGEALVEVKLRHVVMTRVIVLDPHGEPSRKTELSVKCKEPCGKETPVVARADDSSSESVVGTANTKVVVTSKLDEVEVSGEVALGTPELRLRQPSHWEVVGRVVDDRGSPFESIWLNGVWLESPAGQFSYASNQPTLTVTRKDWAPQSIALGLTGRRDIGDVVLKPLSGGDLPSQARLHLRHKEYTAAIAVLDDCVRLTPKNFTCFKLRGSAHASLQERERAYSDYSRYLELAPPDDADYSRVEAFLRQARF